MVDPVEADKRNNPQGPQADPTPAEAPNFDIPMQGDKSNFQAREALHGQVRDYVANMSDAQVVDLAEQLLRSPNLSAEQAKLLRAAFEETLAARRDLRETVSGVLNSSPERFDKLFEKASDEQLKSFYSRVYGTAEACPQSREELLKALGTQESIARLVSDPSVTAGIAQLLLASGALTTDERQNLLRAFSRANDSMLKMREALAVGLTEALLHAYEYKPATGTLVYMWSSGSDDSLAQDGLREPLLLRGGEGAFNQHERDAEILVGIGEKIRRQQEAEESRESKEARSRDGLREAIEKLKDLNSGLMISIHGSRLEQETFQHALQHPSAFGETLLAAPHREAEQFQRRSAA